LCEVLVEGVVETEGLMKSESCREQLAFYEHGHSFGDVILNTGYETSRK
jgi:hypothetical protein